MFLFVNICLETSHEFLYLPINIRKGMSTSPFSSAHWEPSYTFPSLPISWMISGSTTPSVICRAVVNTTPVYDVFNDVVVLHFLS